AEEKIVNVIPKYSDPIDKDIKILLDKYSYALEKATKKFDTPINLIHDSNTSEYEYHDWIINQLWQDVFLDVNGVKLRMQVEKFRKIQKDLQDNTDPL
ncbi:11955_t:CDS:2, partial [Entrophospora sp. SA101]